MLRYMSGRVKTMAKGKNILTTGDVARICNVAPRTVSKWFDNGQLKGYKIPGTKDRRIPVSELVRFMKANNMPLNNLLVGRTRILVIDSHDDLSVNLVEQLNSQMNYEIRTVQAGFESGLAVQKFAPHVIIVNLLSDDIDAADLCKNIRSDEDLQTIKILALVKKIDPEHAHELMQKGFDGYITYPADLKQIIQAIEQVTAIVY